MERCQGKTVAVVGCGTSAVGKGLGALIDSCDIVVRANRAYITQGISADYGTRTDILVIGNLHCLWSTIPTDASFEVYPAGLGWWEARDAHVKAWYKLTDRVGSRWRRPDRHLWDTSWTHSQRPLAGTAAAVMAAMHKPSAMHLIGLDCYSDSADHAKPNRFKSAFDGHINMPPAAHDVGVDRKALETLPCDNVTWHR